MNILSETVTYSGDTIATIGFFDGVHGGHRYVLEQLKRESKTYGLKSLVISFSNHPMLFFHPEASLSLLNTPDEKMQHLADEEIDYCLLLNFDSDLSKMTSYQFLQFLARDYGVKRLLVGYDHHFGSDHKATFQQYQQYGREVGIEIEKLPSFKSNNLNISSSKIRNYLNEGNVEMASKMLGYPYYMNGRVTEGNKIGRQIGFPTANLVVHPYKLIPKNGVYQVDVQWHDKQYQGIANIGCRPTLSGDNKTIEVHIIDFNQDIYNESLSISFVKYLREEHKFDSLEELRKQIERDKETVLSGK